MPQRGGIAGALRPRVGDLRQLASVRRIVLDDGPERGVRALAFSTGGGLDFWVLSDRALDIGPAWWRGMPLGWQSPGGFRSPSLTDLEADGGRGFNRSFSGFLVTCGLDHIRQPADGHPLHGRFPFTPARLLAYGEDWDRDTPVLFCEGEAVQARYGGEALRLRRRIEAPIGGGEVRISDTVENLAAEESPHAMLYHFNLGYPAVATGSVVRLESQVLLGPISLPDAADPPVSASYPAGAASQATCHVGGTDATDFCLSVRFATDTLPHLQLWRDLRPNAGIIAVEPCSSPRGPEGSNVAGPPLAAGERRSYALTVSLQGALPVFNLS